MTLDDLKQRGYSFDRHSECNDCGESIEWWRTPSGGWAAYVPMKRGSDEAVIHRRVCSEYNKEK